MMQAQTAWAVQQVSNLGEPTVFTYSFSGSLAETVILAGKFTTGNAAMNIQGATLFLENTPTNGLGTYELTLYTNGGATPGTLLGTFDTHPTLSESAGTAQVTFSSITGLAGAANTTYWLGIRNTTGDYMGWTMTNSDNQTSSTGWTIADSGMARSQSTGASWIDAIGDVASFVPRFAVDAVPVPEPNTSWLLALAGVVGVFRTRRRR